jgi:hypothetical protein
MLASENTKLKNLMERQLTVNKNNPESFFSRIQDILDLYNLPPIYVLVDVLPTKLAWKRGINLNTTGCIPMNILAWTDCVRSSGGKS